MLKECYTVLPKHPECPPGLSRPRQSCIKLPFKLGSKTLGSKTWHPPRRYPQMLDLYDLLSTHFLEVHSSSVSLLLAMKFYMLPYHNQQHCWQLNFQSSIYSRVHNTEVYVNCADPGRGKSSSPVWIYASRLEMLQHLADKGRNCKAVWFWNDQEVQRRWPLPSTRARDRQIRLSASSAYTWCYYRPVQVRNLRRFPK